MQKFHANRRFMLPEGSAIQEYLPNVPESSMEDLSRSHLTTPDRMKEVQRLFQTNVSQDGLNDTSFYSIGQSCRDNSFLSKSNFDHSKVSYCERDKELPSNIFEVGEKSFKKTQKQAVPAEQYPQVEELKKEYREKMKAHLEDYSKKNNELNIFFDKKLNEYKDLQEGGQRVSALKSSFEAKLDALRNTLESQQDAFRQRLKESVMNQVMAQLESKYNERIRGLDQETRSYVEQMRSRVNDFMLKKLQEYNEFASYREQSQINVNKLAKETKTIWDRKLKAVTSQLSIKIDVLEKNLESTEMANDPNFDRLVYDYNTKFEKVLEKYEDEIKDIKQKLETKVTEGDLTYYMNVNQVEEFIKPIENEMKTMTILVEGSKAERVELQKEMENMLTYFNGYCKEQMLSVDQFMEGKKKESAKHLSSFFDYQAQVDKVEANLQSLKQILAKMKNETVSNMSNVKTRESKVKGIFETMKSVLRKCEERVRNADHQLMKSESENEIFLKRLSSLETYLENVQGRALEVVEKKNTELNMIEARLGHAKSVLASAVPVENIGMVGPGSNRKTQPKVRNLELNFMELGSGDVVRLKSNKSAQKENQNPSAEAIITPKTQEETKNAGFRKPKEFDHPNLGVIRLNDVLTPNRYLSTMQITASPVVDMNISPKFRGRNSSKFGSIDITTNQFEGWGNQAKGFADNGKSTSAAPRPNVESRISAFKSPVANSGGEKKGQKKLQNAGRVSVNKNRLSELGFGNCEEINIEVDEFGYMWDNRENQQLRDPEGYPIQLAAEYVDFLRNNSSVLEQELC